VCGAEINSPALSVIKRCYEINDTNKKLSKANLNPSLVQTTVMVDSSTVNLVEKTAVQKVGANASSRKSPATHLVGVERPVVSH